MHAHTLQNKRTQIVTATSPTRALNITHSELLVFFRNINGYVIDCIILKGATIVSTVALALLTV